MPQDLEVCRKKFHLYSLRYLLSNHVKKMHKLILYIVKIIIIGWDHGRANGFFRCRRPNFVLES